MIDPKFITSSNINAVGFDNETLFIRFNSGESYSYAGVPYTVFDALQKVESAGKYFHQHIRNKFGHTHLTSDPFTGQQKAA